ncbi:MAG: AAA family ATPase, partial [Cyanobacteria bacterium P01_F01_bin.53]
DKYLASRHIINLGQIEKDVRYANKRMYKLEKQLLSQVKKSMTRQSFRVAFRHIRSAVLEHGLTPEQVKALHEITARGQIKVLSGISGTGKTHTLGAARQAWKNQGYTVIGVSLSGRQTQRLAEQTTKQPNLISELVGTKDQNMTISRLLWEIERAEKSQRQYGSRSIFKSPLSNKTVVIADNAQAIGVTQMKRLVEAVRKAGAKLVLSGDVCQPQAYSHSGSFSAIAKSVGAAKLTRIQRQEQAITKSIVKEVAQGDAFSALETLNEQRLLSISETKDQALMEIIKEWSVRGMQRPHDHLLVAHTSDDAEKLNRLAQIKLIDAGILKQTGTRVGRDFIRSGDRVHFQESAKTYGILRNNRGTVRHIDPVTKLAIVRLDTGKTRAINLRVYSGMTLGYAVTTPQSKDVEVRHAYLLAEGSGRDSALLQVSRAKTQTKVYAYSVESELEAQLELAQKMSWSKQNELSVMMRHEWEQER